MAYHNLPKFENLAQFLVYHLEHTGIDDQRLGQRFCNTYIKGPWPELFYNVSYHESLSMILAWLERHSYSPASLPPQLGSGQP